MTSMFWYFIPPIALVAGAIVGSFINVVALRYGRQRITGRSACPSCQRTLQAIDLIPIISFILLRGRCRRCQQPISVQYPLVELFLGLTALILFIPLPQTLTEVLLAVSHFAAIAILVALFFIDLRTMLLPDRHLLILSGIIAVIIALSDNAAATEFSIAGIAYGATIGAGFLALLWLVTKGKGLGIGDIKLMVPLGAFFGPLPTITLLFVAFVTGGALSAALLITGKVTMKTAVPFGPYLTGTAILFILLPELPTWILATVLRLPL